ncbi:MAG TPA: TonB-dependent receptor [Bacteroidales bacterium]|nr:TonB-dependent receptor [Bacteroidales bacterium]
MKKKFIICIMVLSYHVVNAQNTITGIITDQNNLPLAGTTIYIPDLNKGTVADNNGSYELTNLPNGKIKIQFSYIGYINRIETINLSGENLKLDINLIRTTLEAGEVIVSGGYNSTQHGNAVKVDVLNLNPVTTKNTPNFSEVLTHVPGVDMISKGSGVSKPVIRGLSMNDILILNNGMRYENYQYSSHHPLGIDEFGIGNIEIIKGPASLLYGSDAIGGVINFIKEKPAPVNTISGDYNMQLFSNTNGMTNNFGIKSASRKFFGGIRIGQKTNADFLQGGGDFAPNSRSNELSIKTNAGYTGKNGTFKFFYDYSNQKLGLVEDDAVDEVRERGRKNNIWYQEFNTHLLSSQNKLYLGKTRLEFNSSYQNTELIHFGEEDVTEIQMRLETLIYEAMLHLPSKENTEYIIGFQGFNQQNKNINNRKTILLPDATTNNYSAFGLLQYTFFKKLKLQTGVRYDNKSISTHAIGSPATTETYRAPVDKSYGSLSGSFGATFNYSGSLLFRANFAAAYRTPNLAELTSKGPHELRFEIGDKDLVAENSFESDLSIHYHIDNFIFDLAGFYNKINDYIFISPTDDTTTSGMNIYRYRQTDSFLFGGEAGLHFHPEQIKWLHSELTFSSVIGKQNNGDYLPFIPAHKLNFIIKAETEKLLFLHNAFISFSTNTAFNQNNAAPDETPTSGYTLIDTSSGFKIKPSKQTIFVSISANNLFDKKYIDHLSTLKEVGLYNPGRNITLNLKILFEATTSDIH